MRETQLYINDNPSIKSYMHHAYILSILEGKKDIEEWLMNSYIFVRWGMTPNQFNFIYYFPYTWLKCIEVQEDVYKNIIKSNFEEFVIESIKNNYYVYAYVDDYYLPGREAYNKYHFSHDLLIYGFNLDRENFLAIGYFDNIYKRKEIPFKDIVLMHSQYEFSVNEPLVQLLKLNSNVGYKFDIRYMYNSLITYLNGGDPYKFDLDKRYGSNWPGNVYGYKTYDSLLNYLHQSYAENKKFDLRYFSVLLEHKIMLERKVRYLSTNKYIDKNCEDNLDTAVEIVNLASVIKQMIIKYNYVDDQKNKRNIYDKILELLYETMKREKQLLLVLIKQIKGGLHPNNILE